MSELSGCTFRYPLSPGLRLFEKIRVFADCELSQLQLLTPLALVVHSMEKQMEKEALSFDIGLPINCIFSGRDSFSLKLLPEEKAAAARILFFSVPRLEPNYGSKALYTILAEKLCQQIWNIPDQTLAAFKAFEVLRHIFPDLEIREIYSAKIASRYLEWIASHPEAPSL